MAVIGDVVACSLMVFIKNRWPSTETMYSYACMTRNQRLSAGVDAELIKAAEDAAARGRSESMSAWVNDALRLKLAQERRLEALTVFVAAYESEHGEITPEEMRLAARSARESAITVRGARAVKSSLRPRRRSSR
jgi:hypothetical protein